MPTVEEKYQWLCKQLEITDLDYWEGDALIRLKKPIYIALNVDNGLYKVPSVDQAIAWAVTDKIGNPGE